MTDSNTKLLQVFHNSLMENTALHFKDLPQVLVWSPIGHDTHYHHKLAKRNMPVSIFVQHIKEPLLNFLHIFCWVQLFDKYFEILLFHVSLGMILYEFVELGL